MSDPQQPTAEQLRLLQELIEAVTLAERKRCAVIARAEKRRKPRTTQDAAHNNACEHIARAIEQGGLEEEKKA